MAARSIPVGWHALRLCEGRTCQGWNPDPAPGVSLSSNATGQMDRTSATRREMTPSLASPPGVRGDSGEAEIATDWPVMTLRNEVDGAPGTLDHIKSGIIRLVDRQVLAPMGSHGEGDLKSV